MVGTLRGHTLPNAQEQMWVCSAFCLYPLELTGFWWWFVFRPWRTFNARVLPARQVRSARQLIILSCYGSHGALLCRSSEVLD